MVMIENVNKEVERESLKTTYVKNIISSERKRKKVEFYILPLSFYLCLS